MSAGWYPLVFGRTYEVDYRYLAVPEDATFDLKWADRHIDVLLAGHDQLRQGQPRYAVFQNSTHCVCGIACDVSVLGAEKEIQRDRAKRWLYTFVGYVLPLRAHQLRPVLPRAEIEPFRNLLRFMRDQWEVTYTKTTSTQTTPPPIRTRPEPVTFVQPPPPTDLARLKPAISLHEWEIALWPDEERELLWQTVLYSPTPVSVALGVALRREALDGPFRNVALVGAKKHEKISLTNRTPHKGEQEELYIQLIGAYYILGRRSKHESAQHKQEVEELGLNWQTFLQIEQYAQIIDDVYFLGIHPLPEIDRIQFKKHADNLGLNWNILLRMEEKLLEYKDNFNILLCRKKYLDYFNEIYQEKRIPLAGGVVVFMKSLSAADELDITEDERHRIEEYVKKQWFQKKQKERKTSSLSNKGHQDPDQIDAALDAEVQHQQLSHHTELQEDSSKPDAPIDMERQQLSRHTEIQEDSSETASLTSEQPDPTAEGDPPAGDDQPPKRNWY